MSVSAALSGRCVAHVATPMAERYLAQLCKHFQHRCPVVLDGASGRIDFEFGRCDLRADAGMLTLSLTAAAGDDQLSRLQDVVARHLLRFAFREQLDVSWEPPAATDH